MSKMRKNVVHELNEEILTFLLTYMQGVNDGVEFIDSQLLATAVGFVKKESVETETDDKEESDFISSQIQEFKKEWGNGSSE